MNSVGERLKWARERLGIGQTELAKRAGLKNQSIVGSLESGHRKNSSHVPALADALGINPKWLSTGKGVPEDLCEGNVSPGPRIRGNVPIINNVQAGNYIDVIDHLQPGEGERVDTTFPVNRYTYALRVEGDSMEPVLPAGVILIVEPEMQPEPGDYVIVRNGEGASVKKLILDGKDWYLKPENPRYPIKPLPDGAVICGVVRGLERKFR